MALSLLSSGGQVPKLSETLKALGFRCTGLHHAKRVERWTQGQVNLVFNREDGSFANRYYDRIVGLRLWITNPSDMNRA